MTVPLAGKWVYNETTAIAMYSQATHLDPSQGIYPPQDPGTNAVDVCNAAIKDGYIKAFHTAVGLNDTLTTLMQFPIMIGANWYDSFDNPDSKGLISISPDASVRGGHEWELSGIVDPVTKICKAWNSWGEDWGDAGAMYLSFETLERLLAEQGDATIPVV